MSEKLKAHLWVCSGCRGHGHIVFANGKLSDEFCCKEQAFKEMEKGIKDDVISAEEARELDSQIDASSFLLTEKDVNPEILESIREQNRLRQEKLILAAQCGDGSQLLLPN